MKRKPKKPYHSVQVDVTVTKKIIPHRPGEIKTRHLSGQKRREAQKRLTTDAATTIHYTEFSKMKTGEIEQGKFTNCQSEQVLRQAKTDWHVYDTLHKDAFTELTISREIFLQ